MCPCVCGIQAKHEWNSRPAIHKVHEQYHVGTMNMYSGDSYSPECLSKEVQNLIDVMLNQGDGVSGPKSNAADQQLQNCSSDSSTSLWT